MCIIVLYHHNRYWIEGQGWATTNVDRATRYSRADANRLASRLRGEVVRI